MLVKFLIFVAFGALVVASQLQDPKMRFFLKLGEYQKVDETQKTFTKTYFISHNEFRLTWSDALMFCRQFDMELASLEEQHEMDNFLDFLNNAPANYVERHQHIGATELGSPSNWYWAPTGKNINYTIKWGPGEPNKLSGEHCMTVTKYNTQYFYNDAQCTGTNHILKFICEQIEEN